MDSQINALDFMAYQDIKQSLTQNQNNLLEGDLEIQKCIFALFVVKAITGSTIDAQDVIFELLDIARVLGFFRKNYEYNDDILKEFQTLTSGSTNDELEKFYEKVKKEQSKTRSKTNANQKRTEDHEENI